MKTWLGLTCFFRGILRFRLVPVIEPLYQLVRDDRRGLLGTMLTLLRPAGDRTSGLLRIGTLPVVLVAVVRLTCFSGLLERLAVEVARSPLCVFQLLLQSPSLVPEIAIGLLAVWVAGDEDVHAVRAATCGDDVLILLLLFRSELCHWCGS